MMKFDIKTNHKKTQSVCEILPFSLLPLCVCVLGGQVPCGEDDETPSAWRNTSAAPFSHALCLFKVTSEKGICIGKRNSEYKGPRALLPHVGTWRTEMRKTLKLHGATKALTHIFFHCLTAWYPEAAEAEEFKNLKKKIKQNAHSIFKRRACHRMFGDHFSLFSNI